MKKLYFILFLLVGMAFCGNTFAEEINLNDNDAEFVYDDSEVIGLINATRVGASTARYNGMRVILPNTNGIWLIEGGKRRLIKSMEVYFNLFKDKKGIRVSPFANEIPVGRDLPGGTFLFKGKKVRGIFVMDHGRKRHIVSGPTITKYYFNPKKIRVREDSFVKAVPNGRKWR